jgi:hypothetical protein
LGRRVAGFPYKAINREERNRIMMHAAAEAEQQMPVSGIVVIGIDVDSIV